MPHMSIKLDVFGYAMVNLNPTARLAWYDLWLIMSQRSLERHFDTLLEIRLGGIRGIHILHTTFLGVSHLPASSSMVTNQHWLNG